MGQIKVQHCNKLRRGFRIGSTGIENTLLRPSIRAKKGAHAKIDEPDSEYDRGERGH